MIENFLSAVVVLSIGALVATLVRISKTNIKITKKHYVISYTITIRKKGNRLASEKAVLGAGDYSGNPFRVNPVYGVDERREDESVSRDSSQS